MPTDLQPLSTDYGPAREDANAFTDIAPTVKVQPQIRADRSSIQRTSLKLEKSKFLTMKTDFRTLRYGNDQVSYGSSGQPYIRTALDQSFTTPVETEYTKRPGLNGVALFSAIDKDRVGRFLANSTQGKLFAAKQRSLLLANPKMEVGTNFNSVNNTNAGVLQSILNNAQKGGALEYTRVYNDNRSLLQQVGANGTGLHLDYPGTSASTPFQSKYEFVVRNKTAEQNRLVLLAQVKIDQDTFRGVNEVPPSVLPELNRLGISRSQNKLFEYAGGPSSGGEATWSTIKRYVYSNTWARFSSYFEGKEYRPGKNQLLDLIPKYVEGNEVSVRQFTGGVRAIIKPQFVPVEYDPSKPEYSMNHSTYATSSFTVNTTFEIGSINRAKAMSYYDLIQAAKGINTQGAILPDFREAAGAPVSSSGYNGDLSGVGYLEKNYGLGNPGHHRQKNVTYGQAGKGQFDAGVDKVNLLDVGQSYQGGTKDFVKCIISAVETQQDTTTLTNVIVPIVFRAFISNFSDNINANYNEFQYVGRGEKFYTYNSSDRKISFQLAVAAQSRVEMQPLYRKLNYLISQLHPGYSGFGAGGGNGFMRAPLVKMTIGDYLFDQPGFLTSINISVPQEASWEIAQDKEMDADMYQLPQYLTLNINFTPIHNFIARRGFKSGNDILIPPFITPNEKITSNNKNLFDIGQ